MKKRSAELTVNAVNDAPVADNDTYSTDEDTPLTVSASGVLANDTDAESDPLHGIITLNSDGSFTYTPEAEWNGTDSFTYKASDGSTDSGAATVTVTVIAVNDAPAADSDKYTTDEDTALTIEAPGILANDTDAEGTSLTVSEFTEPSNGSLELNSDGSFTCMILSRIGGNQFFFIFF
ncbi:MAG: tandem-95 repeat protein [Desulfobacteraceae bacterium]|nr:tandem-95 repeat protein [Desulfobacteraceae bacterium]